MKSVAVLNGTSPPTTASVSFLGEQVEEVRPQLRLELQRLRAEVIIRACRAIEKVDGT